ncbi:MAG: DUF3416 domain-containing protein [Candidatus Hydrogenedentes bacterium CG07_land_8_20_14_0_80_42_17]|nr:MAG: DUF3416 domain-containing protein [Candidatus Hydrogenedentes bacterium CG07_land_8_20_14_0_80_42_17]
MKPKSVVIENVRPIFNEGRYPIKREVGDTVTVWADIFRDGHELFEAFLVYREKGSKKWSRTPMEFVDNDRWRGTFQLEKNARYEYTIEAWPQHLQKVISRFKPILEVVADRPLARYAAWYEMFHRSQGKIEGKSATFDDMIARLPEIKEMGFDVIYLPPIHPIGETNRKGKNNLLKALPEEPGSPWAIGNKSGGHKAVNPELGTLEDFDRFAAECKKMNFEIALDFALNCSPDHPYVAEHSEWYYKNPDGTIKFAENPPKKYEDIYPLNFYCEDWKELWKELLSIIVFWRKHGVTIFRVDNPHTKPAVFWEWLIAKAQEKYPDLIFLSEAFTKPKMMKALAKAGFTQSYTYFTWRNSKSELTEYLTELTQSEMKEYFRGNLFTNTPDILTEYLQKGGRPAFITRSVLAATLSSVYGIYNGFELCENTPKEEGKEEYLDSEKYQYKVWDWDRPGNIKAEISKINKIRQENPALHEYENLKFFKCDNDNVIFYGKMTSDRSNIICVAVNLDPFHRQITNLYLPLDLWGIEDWETFKAHELLTDRVYQWKGGKIWNIPLGPEEGMTAIWRISKN